MVAHGGGEGFSCPECGEAVGDSVDRCPKCNTPIERKIDPAEDDSSGDSPSEVRSSPEFHDAVQSLESSEETLGVGGVQRTVGETSMTDTNEESNIGEQPNRKTDDLCVSATDSKQTLETCNSASVSASDEESKQGSEEHSGCSGAGDPANDSEDFSIIDHVDPKHFDEGADMSDVRSEEDSCIFADAKDHHDEVGEADSKNDSSDSSSMPTWEIVDHDEVVVPPCVCDKNVGGKSDVLLDSEIDAIGEVRSDQGGAAVGHGIDESDAIEKVKSDQDGAAVGHGVGEGGDVPTTVEKKPEEGGEDKATSEDQAPLPMDISDSEGNLSDGTQLERRFSGLHVEMANSPRSSGDGVTDGQLDSAEDVAQTSDGQIDEDVVMVGETQSRSSSVDFGITESNDSASNHSSEERLEGSVPVAPPEKQEHAPDPVDDMPVESIRTDQSIEPFDSLYHQTLSLTWDTSDLFCHGNIPPPLCDGYDSDSKDACNKPISESKRCPSCGQKNKFVRCKKPHDDGSPCMLFIVQRNGCPCCEAAEEAKAAKAESMKEAMLVPDNVNLMCHSDIPPPVCDGYDSDDEACKHPVSETKRCMNCGKKNMYVRCKEVHDDGTFCVLLIRRDEPCPCCEAAKAAKDLPPEPPVCNGVNDDDGNPCQERIGPWNYCPECGEKNKYTPCQGQSGDGSLCKWFVLPGKSCPMCQTVAAALRQKSKKPVSQEKVKEPAKDTELRGMPAYKRPRTTLSLEPSQRSVVKEVQPCSMDWGHSDQSGDAFSHLTGNAEARHRDRGRLREVQACSMDSGRSDQSGDASPNLPGNDETRHQDHGRPSLDSVSSADTIPYESNPDHSTPGEVGDGDGSKVSHLSVGSPSSYREPDEKTISDESTPEEEQCKVNEFIPKDAAMIEEKRLGGRSTQKSSQRPGEEDQKSSDHTNAGLFSSSMAVVLYKGQDETGQTCNQGDKVFGTSQDVALQAGAVSDHPLAHIDRENGNDDGASASKGDSVVNRVDSEMELSGESRRKREFEGSQEGATKEAGGKKLKDTGSGPGWYQKKEEPAVLFDGTKVKTRSQTNKDKGSKGNENSTIQQQSRIRKMKFHVVLHRKFRFDPKNDAIVIRFAHLHLGGFNDLENRHRMEVVRTYKKGYILMELTIDMPDYITVSEYKYVCVHKINKKEPEYVWEWMPNHDEFSQVRINRQFRVDYKQASKITEMDMYDGLMYPRPEKPGFMKKVGRWITGYDKTELVDEVKEAASAMLPHWHMFCFENTAGQKVDQSTAEETVQNIDQVFKYMEKSLSVVSERNFKEIWTEVLWEHLSAWETAMKVQINETKTNPDVLEARLVSALTILRLIYKFNTILADESRLDLLCECLLLRPDKDGKILPLLTMLPRHFKAQKLLVVPLLFLVQQLTTDTNRTNSETHHKWLFVVPLIHFLNEESVPYEQVWDVYGVEHNKTPWWGIRTFTRFQQKFKDDMNYKGKLKLTFLMRLLKPLFHVDALLPRTIMTVLSWQHIKTAYAEDAFPLDCSIANCCFFINSTQATYLSDDKVDYMHQCIELLLQKTEKTFSTADVDKNKQDALMKEMLLVERLAWNLLNVFLRVTRPTGIWHRAWMIVPGVLQLMARILDTHFYMIEWIPKEGQNAMRAEHGKTVSNYTQEMKNDLVSWLYAVLNWRLALYNSFKEPKEPEMWSKLLAVEFSSENAKTTWRKALLNVLENRIRELTPKEQVEMYCGRTDFASYDKGIDETFSKVAFQAVSQEVNILSIVHHDKSKYRFLMSRMFTQAWDKVVGDKADGKKIMMHMLSWPSFARCLEIFSTDKREALFDPTCIEHIATALSVLSHEKDLLLKNTISVTDFELLLKHQDSFIALCCIEAAREDETHLAEGKAKQETLRAHLTQFFQLRQQELEYFRQTSDKLLTLLGQCANLNCKVHTESLANLLHGDLGKRMMGDIVDPAQVPYKGKNVPRIRLFGLSGRVLGILDKVKALSTSIILNRLWAHFGQVEKEDMGSDAPQLQLDETVEKVWQPAWDRWSELVSMLNFGNVTLNQIDEHFGCFKKKIADIKVELECMRDFVDVTLNVEEILKQIDLYYKLDGFTKGAVTILKVKKEMGLTGDFSQVETLANVTEHKHKPLRNMNKNLLTTGKILENITDKQVECLNAVAECQELVDWLKGIGGTKELKVFVDLASTTAGEGDMDLDRVSMLHAVVTGYAPLICDLKQDATAEIFLDHCKMVWRALESDNKLTSKLLDTKRHMAWLKFIKDSHGSVEVSSLSEVDAINGRGVYKVGNLKEGHKDIRDVILLTVPVLKDDPKRMYNFDQLNELQSKLMLMSSGKRGNQDESVHHSQIDRFTEIFEGVTRLAKAYIRICSAGNILFQDWVSTLYCNWTVKNNVRVDFHLEKGILMEKNQGQLTQQIHNLANFMESCLQDWQDYLVKQRAKYPQLNHFTTAQIVLLRSEFAKVTGADVDNLTYNMLHSVKTNARREDLIGAVRAALNFLEEKASPQKENTEQIEEEMPEEPAENLLDLKERLMGAGFCEKLVGLAIQEKLKKGCDEDECIVWCLDNREKIDNAVSDDDDDEDGDVTMKDDDDTEMMRNLDRLQPTTSMNTVTSELLGQLDKNEKALCDQLKELWDKFLGAVSMSVKDYRSVEHLGLILDRLSDRGDRRIERTFPPFLHSGRPNLIVCPEADIYNMVLSLYLDDPQLPLPDDEEILLCTNTTTTEEVELLWQRATCDQMNQGKIYCLVNADRLDYDVSDSVEKSLEKHIKGKKDYRLVIVCSSEREDKSRMVTALDRDRRNPLIRPIVEISAYLKQQFKSDYPGEQSAPKLDYDHCSVRLVKSATAGVGKTLIATRMSQALKPGATVGIPLHERYVTESDLVEKLIVRTQAGGRNVARLFHIDIGHDVVDGVDHVLFNLLVLRCIKDASGRCWRRSPADLYLIENLPLLKREVQRTNQTEKVQFVHRMLNILPSVTCRPPKETLKILRNEYKPEDFSRDDPLLHNDICTSQEFQRPYRYLKDLTVGQQDIPPFFWLELLLRYCGVENPSWAELRHFISFLNIQLQDCEHSIFCSDILKDDLPGFTAFVVNFMIQMSKDFATRSLIMSEETPQLPQDMTDEAMEEEEEDELPIALRRRWETSPHPYIFFNTDHNSLTFLGFNIDKETGNLIDHQTRAVLKEKIMSKQLFDALNRQGVNLLENFDNLSRADKITKLCTVMGTEVDHDPDETYELTTDNVKKMLAIFMRFRCSIPVVVMGETGCGKTRLIKFMCDLQTQPGVDVKNMVLMKVHGGTSHDEIIAKVQEAQTLAAHNRVMFPKMDTILFFDEANTTEAIGLIKEIMCDLSMNGERIATNTGLKFVAACNPYRKHSQEMIHNLEQAGLGYNVKADQTADKLGRVPMRQLVYRVQPLPQSMLPLVWDFGQLSDEVEKMYIRQIVQRYIEHGQLPNYPGLNGVITNILAASQDFMRQQKNECSFVSLRDVERSMDVMSWFFSQRKLLYKLMDGYDDKAVEAEDEVEDEEEEEEEDEVHRDDVTRSLILALGVCYHACLQEVTRVAYRDHIAGFFQPPCTLPDGSAADLLHEITRCQDVFLEQVKIIEPNIAPNQALKENLFMMVVCIELRIPLFLVGKPGSSKSLAKLIVTDAMQGETARSPLFKALKQVHMVSFQCSPLATPDGIKGTFKQCARFQKDKNLHQFVSVVVLDEVGLAEDSPRMPLKTLHPLLEDGTCGNDDEPLPHKKVAFIGISNWALDPAKMNRGILVQRGVPDEGELRKSAEGICSTDVRVLTQIKSIIPNMAKAYLELYNSALEIREFFGLRDFYSLVKMVYAFAALSGQPATWYQLEHAVRRNFGGLENTDPVKVFAEHCNMLGHHQRPRHDDPRCDPTGLIEACLYGNEDYKESRYLLILTENYAALGILQQHLLTMQDTIVIFGSSFRSDQEYTQVCRNINRIKKCMDTGKTVVLLNLESLYESLYDALNQYYVYMGGQRYVDLGLGTHRVKCRVDEKFRLIVVAEKDVVYEKFPIPLINRLEKHFLATTTVLDQSQIKVAKKVEKWATDFVTTRTQVVMVGTRVQKQLTPGDVFCGYHADTAASIVLQITKALGKPPDTPGWAREVYTKCKDILLACATPDSVLRLKNTRLQTEELELVEKYFENNKHRSLQDHVRYLLKEYEAEEDVFLEVTSRSHLLAKKDAKALGTFLKIPHWRLLALQAMDTKQQFSRELREFFDQDNDERVMLLQCDSGDQNSNLIACARYQIMEEYNKNTTKKGRTHFIFIIQMPRVVAGTFVGFQGGKWHSVHLDDLRPPAGTQPSVISMKQQSISCLIHEAVERLDMPRQKMGGRQETEMETEASLLPGSSTSMPMEMSESLDMDQINLLGLDDLPRQPSAEELSQVMQMSMERAQVVEGCVGTPEEDGAMSLPHQAPQPTRIFDRTKEVLDLDSLILACLQGAAAMIKDPDTVVADRPTRRLQILSKELSRQDGLSLMKTVKIRIDQLLTDKENVVMNQRLAQDWLSKDAAAPENINRAGTFSRAIRMVIEGKIMPTLAGLVAYLDTNSNLDILQRRGTARDKWIYTLWLEMLADVRVTQLSYEKLLLSPKSYKELTEMIAQQMGAGRQTFRPLFPFSWEVYTQMEIIIQTAKTMKNEGFEQTCRVLFNNSAIGMFLKDFLNDKPATVHDEMVDLYISDFIHMSVRCGQEGMQEILTKTLKAAFRETHRDLDAEGDDLYGQLTIPKLHLTFMRFHERFEHFIQACLVWKNCVAWLKKEPGHDLNATLTEMTLDVNILVKMVDYISSLDEKLKTPKGRQEWSETAKAFKPVIDGILHSKCTIGPISQQYMKQYRPLWMRICVVQMFIDHVCPPHIKEEAGRVDSIKPLWMLLGKEANFHMPKSLKKVAEFLRSCNFSAVKKFYKIDSKCIACEEPMKDPVVLPCKHRICRTCFRDQMEVDNRECLQCKAIIPKDFVPPKRGENRKADESYNRYIRACNEFFMDLVSQLCFAEDQPPTQEVIEILMSYVIHEPRGDKRVGMRSRTKELTVYDECIDPSPVLRSLLLQLLLRYSSDDVRDHLQFYFERSQRFLKEPAHITELSLLCARCFEDSYHSHCGLQPGNALAIRVEFATKCLRLAEKDIGTNNLDILKVEAISMTRFGMSVAAEMMNRICILKEENHDVHAARRLWDAALKLHEASNSKWPRLFLVKQLCRNYGMDSLDTVTQNRYLAWVMPDEARGREDNGVDRFILFGAQYQTIRDEVAAVILGGSVEDFKKKCQGLNGNNQVKEVSCLLALHREVYTHNLFEPNVAHRVADQTIDVIQNVCIKQAFMNNKQALVDTLEKVKSNKIGPQPVQVDRMTKDMWDLLVQTTLVMQSLKETPLLKPFKVMASQAGKMKDAYLPVMPHDHLEETREMLLKARGSVGGDDNPTFYSCSRGHPYVIGNCGRPVEKAKCWCGTEIGGIGYQLKEGNQKMEHRDNTQKGYVLGVADMRNLIAIPEREMSPAATTIVRLLLHLSMHIGTKSDLPGVTALIQPAIPADQVRAFLLDHIRHDIQVLGRAINKSPDDCLTLMIILIGTFMKNKKSDTRFNADLATKEARRDWEKAFTETYVNPALNDLDKILNGANTLLVNDDRLSNNPLIKIVHEMISLGDQVDISQIHDCHLMWQFRSRVTVEHLTQLMNEHAGDKCPAKILKQFIHEEPHLRLLSRLPDIIRLQQMLIQRYQRRISQPEARIMTIKEVLHELDLQQRGEWLRLLEVFTNVWKNVKDMLVNYSASGYTLPEEMCKMTVNPNTPIAMLIPSSWGLGLCSIMLVEYLTRRQNEFIMAYCRYRSKDSRELPTFGVTEATAAHLIYYDPEKDLLPMVLAHCNYSLEVGKGTVINYDFVGLERELEERLLRGKPKLVFDVAPMVFKTEYRNAMVIFSALRDNINQEPMSHAVQAEILRENRVFQDLCETLASLDITITWLREIRREPETKLVTFMHDTLEMDKRILSPQIQQHCLLMHVQSLWLLLTMERSKQLTHHNQDAFEDVSEEYHQPLEGDNPFAIQQALQHLNIDRFVSELYECILLNINIQRSPNEEDFQDNTEYSLADVMTEYISSKDGTEISALNNGTFPKEVKVKHAVAVWMEAVKLQLKEQRRR